MEKLRTAMDFCIRHQKILGYSMVSLLTAASEYIFSSVVFKCPCNSWNTVYGCVFLIAPAFVLFLLGYMINARVWLFVTGRCSPENQCGCDSCRNFLKVLVPVTASTLVAPFTWIAVALLSASFYECAASRNSFIRKLPSNASKEFCNASLEKIPCDKELSKKIGEFHSLQSESQMVGWLLIAIIMTAALISKCFSRCCSPVSYFQMKFWKIYLKKEREVFEIKAKDHAAKLAERNVHFFFEPADLPPPFWTPNNEDWQKISFPYGFNTEEQHYSMIHKYVNTNRGKASSERGRIHTVLGFVDEAHASESGF
ncbi:calcium homeostasis modulator protein 6-like [Oxyura jamaicensis]|uniref:calcium homeostasis modulator protein 6-like n=1 Tax=Oxyura jamaicensis TaxID=8884 RepID=UPI0015A5B998|nr:calcium homeostasis modulator protein 6-like [Oxyura jamaicensis]